MTRLLARFAFLGAVLAPAPALAQAIAKDRVALDTPLPRDSAVVTGTLPNGMRFYIRENRRPERRAELRLVVNAGSVLESDDQRGLAHFVEHMAFNGTEHFRKQELVDNVERMGMRFGPHLNAYTSFDETVYQLLVPTDDARSLSTAFTMLEDWAQGVTFDTAEVRKERGVVIEEWRLGQGADARMQRRELPVIFRGSRYAVRLPIGDRQVLETFDPAALRRFYHDWYRPDLMAVVAVGDFRAADIEQLIRRTLGNVPARPTAPVRVSYPVPDHDSTLVVVSTDPEATESEVMVYYKQPQRKQRTVADYRRALVEHLYNRMLNERLAEITRRPNAPFVHGFSGQGSVVRTKEVYVLGAQVVDGGIERGLEAVLTEAERVDRFGFTATELERAKSNILRSMERAFTERDRTSSNEYVPEYVGNFLSGDPYPGIAAEYRLARELLPGIGVAEVNRLASEWITDRNRVVVARAPQKAGVPVPSDSALAAVFARAKGASIATWVDSAGSAPLFGARPAPARVVSERTNPILGTREWTFANGVRVIVKPTDFKADELLFTAYSPGGASLAPSKDFFTASVASTLVQLGGVGPFNQSELRKKLAGIAASATPYIGRDYAGLRGSASPRDLEAALQLANLAFTAPRMDSSAFAAFIANVRASLANRGASPESAFEDTLQVLLAQHDPRARPVTAERLSELDLATAYRFYRDRFADAGDFTFVFVGSVNPDTLLSLTASYLGTLPSTGRRERWRDLGIRPPRGVVQQDVRRGIEPRSRTQIVFTGPFEYNAVNRYLLQSLAEVMSINLRERLREELGGTYGVGVSASPGWIPRGEYSLTIGFGSAPDRAEELRRAIFAYVDTLKRVGADTSVLTKVRETQLRGRETALRQNQYWLSQISFLDQRGEDASQALSIEPMVDRLTGSAIADAARRWLDTDNYVRVTLYPEAKP